jgi:hypothetical protein
MRRKRSGRRANLPIFFFRESFPGWKRLECRIVSNPLERFRKSKLKCAPSWVKTFAVPKNPANAGEKESFSGKARKAIADSVRSI